MRVPPGPEEAAAALVGALNAIVDCVAAQRLVAKRGGDAPIARYSVRFGPLGEPVPLRAKAGGPSGLLLDKRHVPTGLVSLADVVRMLIAEFGIAERRRDWPARLARAEAALRETMGTFA